MTEYRLTCLRCHGKCQAFGWAVPGDPKQTWHPCPACDGKGWVWQGLGAGARPHP